LIAWRWGNSMWQAVRFPPLVALPLGRPLRPLN
jgi:hypothetical protein